MSDSDDKRHRLTVTSPEPGLLLSVIDGRGRLLEQSDEGSFEIDLPRGLYTVRSDRAGHVEERIVRHVADQSISAAVPPRFSPALIPGAQTSHEYYTDSCWDMSQRETVPAVTWNGEANARLMIFVRAVGVDSYRDQRLMDGLTLRTFDDRVVARFSRDETEHSADGWEAFSARLSSGSLLLASEEDPARQLPLPLFDTLQTQVFVMFRERLLLEDLRVMTLPMEDIETRSGRDPHETGGPFAQTTEHMDLGLLALQNDVTSVASSLVTAYLNSKFDNPVLGLLGAYLMLLRRRERRVRKLNVGEASTVRLVIHNLDILLPNSADVVALKHLAIDDLGKPKREVVNGVPLFRVGAEALLEAASDGLVELPPTGVLDQVSDRLWADSAWTSWEPVEDRLEGRDVEVEWLDDAVADLLDPAVQRMEWDASRLVRQLRVSPGAVHRALGRLESRVKQASASELGVSVDRLGSLRRQVSNLGSMGEILDDRSGSAEAEAGSDF